MNSGEGTTVYSMDPGGAMAGYYVNTVGFFRPFARSASGTFTTFTISGALESFATGINAAGTICGYFESLAGPLEGFSRSASGTVTILIAPGAGTAVGTGTEAFSINSGGIIVGPYITSGKVYGAYFWTP